jgi:hypothetical protein
MRDLQLVPKRKLHSGQENPNSIATQLDPNKQTIASSVVFYSGTDREIDTVYHNATPRTLLVMVSALLEIDYDVTVKLQGNSAIRALSDAATPPTSQVAQAKLDANLTGIIAGYLDATLSMTFPVLPNHYYLVEGSMSAGGNVNQTITSWAELTLR